MTLVVSYIVRCVLFWIFARALWHKLKNFSLFRAELENYQLITFRLITPIAISLTMLEFLCVITLLNPQWQLPLLLGAILLSIYALAMTLNLVKGRYMIDCGCSGPLSSRSHNTRISWWLVTRNLLLAALAITATSATPRPLENFEYFLVIATTLCSLLILASLEQALNNAQRQHYALLSSKAG